MISNERLFALYKKLSVKVEKPFHKAPFGKKKNSFSHIEILLSKAFILFFAPDHVSSAEIAAVSSATDKKESF